MESIFQKRTYDLSQYIQLDTEDVGYENPSEIWMLLDKAGWPEAMKFSFSEFIDFVNTTNQNYYLNPYYMQPWESEEEVLAGFPFAERKQFYTVNIDGTEFWFLSDRITLVEKWLDLTIPDESIGLSKIASIPPYTILYNNTEFNAPPQAISLDQLKLDLGVSSNGIHTLMFPTGSVASRCAGVMSIPPNWDIYAGGNPNDLVIVHDEFRHIVDCKVYSVVNGIATLLWFNEAYSGITAVFDQRTVTISNLATIATPINVHLIFA